MMREGHDIDEQFEDRMERHCRQQLSAMLDGELAPDEARFLLRRLQHDHELAGCWERWQICGDLMRGSAQSVLPPDFATRVTQAIANDGAAGDAIASGARHAVAAAATRGSASAWLRWGGGTALAASLAAVALLVGRPAIEAGTGSPGSGLTQPPLADAGSSVADMQAALPARDSVTPGNRGDGVAAAPMVAPGASSLADAPVVPASTATPPAATTGDASPARVAVGRQLARSDARAAGGGTPDVKPHAAAAAVDASAPVGAEAVATMAATTAEPALRHDLFDGQVQSDRPWPRALVPGAGSGMFNASYGAPEAEPGNPFQPQVRLLDPATDHSQQAASPGTAP